MRRLLAALPAAALAALLALTMSPVAWAQQPSDSGAGSAVSLGGAASTDDRVSTEANPQLTFQEYRLELVTDARPSDAAKLHAEAWVRSAGLPSSPPPPSELFTVGGVVLAQQHAGKLDAIDHLHGRECVGVHLGRGRLHRPQNVAVVKRREIARQPALDADLGRAPLLGFATLLRDFIERRNRRCRRAGRR